MPTNEMTTIEPDKMVDFGQLIAQPLIATMEAEVQAAEKFVHFLQAYGMERKKIGKGTEAEERLELRKLTFGYTQQDTSTGKLVSYQVEVPLLSLIPLPLLHIDSAEFDFDIRLFTEVEYKKHPGGVKGSLVEGRGREDTEPNIEDEEGEFKGFQARLSATSGSSEEGKLTQTSDTNMKVRINMKQSDLPVGLIKMMEVFEESTR